MQGLKVLADHKGRCKICQSLECKLYICQGHRVKVCAE